MDDQLKQADAQVAETESTDVATAVETQERYSTGIDPLDSAVHKIDAGVRKISSKLHEGLEIEEDPDRVSSGIKPLDTAVYKLDAGVRRISSGIHKVVDSVKKQ